MNARDAIGVLASGGLTLHLAATILQNTPESFNQEMSAFVGGWPVPGWRFFAPNPGVHNVHLLIRTRDAHQNTSSWRDITPRANHGLTRVLWNPGSRGPKALFDAMQQLAAMGANSVSFEWVVSSTAYHLVAAAARASAENKEVNFLQFTLVNDFRSSPPSERMRPIIVSNWFPPDADEHT